MGSLEPGLGRRGGRGDENPAPTGEGPFRGKKTEMTEPIRNNGLCPFSDSELQTVARRGQQRVHEMARRILGGRRKNSLCELRLERKERLSGKWATLYGDVHTVRDHVRFRPPKSMTEGCESYLATHAYATEGWTLSKSRP